MRRHQTASLVALLLSLVGLGVCAYLTYVHLAMIRGELVGGLGCGGPGSGTNCHVVTGSRFGQLAGMPLSLWGMLGYVAMLALSLIGWRLPDKSEQALAGIGFLATLFMAIDAMLFFIMVTQIHQLCPLCVASYVVNILLLVAALSALSQSFVKVVTGGAGTLSRLVFGEGAAGVAFWGVLLIGAMGVLGVHQVSLYMTRGSPTAFRKQIVDFTTQKPRVQVDTTGDPVHGNPNGHIRIVEFSDFLCPSCQRAWQFNPILLAGRERDASFVFKHYPLDNTCNTALTRQVHAGACEIAAASECAHEQGKFWPFHDLVFKQGPSYKVATIDQDATALGLDMTRFGECRTSGRGLEAVKRDIAEAIRINISRTPTYIINGVMVEGMVSPVMFEELLETLRP